MKLRGISTHQWALGIKAIAFAGSLLALYMLVNIQTQGKATADQTKIIAEQAKIIAEQNKALAEQNNQIATESQSHVDCIAELFARYTRDGRSITITDLSTCQANTCCVSQKITPLPTVEAPQTADPYATPQSVKSASPPPSEPSVVDSLFDMISEAFSNIPKL